MKAIEQLRQLSGRINARLDAAPRTAAIYIQIVEETHQEVYRLRNMCSGALRAYYLSQLKAFLTGKQGNSQKPFWVQLLTEPRGSAHNLLIALLELSKLLKGQTFLKILALLNRFLLLATSVAFDFSESCPPSAPLEQRPTQLINAPNLAF